MALPSRTVWVTDVRLALWVLLAICLARSHSARSTLLDWALGISAAMVAAAGVTLVCMARHAAVCVFNRAHPPPLTTIIYHFTTLLNPLQALFRLATAPLRVLPDVYIVGEVRCGTTTTATLLKRIPGVHGPFCPWIHPLGDKESFFLVGHYCGLIDPRAYRMCFPLRLTRWVHTKLLRRRFLVFDACAQYLTAPWVPHLLRRATPHAKLIVCVRDPVLQNLSWWRCGPELRYELAAMAWGDALGLGATRRSFAELDSAPAACPQAPPYPPGSLRQAVEQSSGHDVCGLYRAAEALRGPWLPQWACTWPRGQLNAFTQCGRYVDNLHRLLRCFAREQIVIVELEELKHSAAVYARLCDSLDVPHDHRSTTAMQPQQSAIWVNGSHPAPPSMEPDADALKELGRFYYPHNLRLFEWLGRDLDWHHASHYAHAATASKTAAK